MDMINFFRTQFCTHMVLYSGLARVRRTVAFLVPSVAFFCRHAKMGDFLDNCNILNFLPSALTRGFSAIFKKCLFSSQYRTLQTYF